MGNIQWICSSQKVSITHSIIFPDNMLVNPSSCLPQDLVTKKIKNWGCWHFVSFISGVYMCFVSMDWKSCEDPTATSWRKLFCSACNCEVESCVCARMSACMRVCMDLCLIHSRVWLPSCNYWIKNSKQMKQCFFVYWFCKRPTVSSCNWSYDLFQSNYEPVPEIYPGWVKINPVFIHMISETESIAHDFHHSRR